MKAFVALLGAVLCFDPAAAAAQNEPDLSSGGLAPPPAIESETRESDFSLTEQELQRADREDSGRGLSFFWTNAEVGFGVFGLHTLQASDLVDSELVPSTQNGPVLGVGAGARLIFLSVGGRFRLGTFKDWQLWTLGAEVGFRIPLGRIEPYFTFGGGYASLGSFGAALEPIGASEKALNIHGFNLRGGAGMDYFIGRSVSVGANLSGDFLFLWRSRVPGVTGGGSGGDPAAESAAEVYGRDGSSVGGATTLMAVVGLHF